MPHFLRSLHATLALRFPLRAAGDPYRSGPAPPPRILSTISLLGLDHDIRPAPFEHLDFQLSYLPHLTRTHIVPLQTIQSLLPLFRMPSRGWGPEDSVQTLSEKLGQSQSIIMCVPAPDALVGVPYAAAQAMSAAATSRGAEVLRRELAQAAHFACGSGVSTATEGGRQIVGDVRVVIIDVGTVGSPTPSPSPSVSAESIGEEDEAIRSWTATEQSVYGAPYLSYLSSIRRGKARRQSPVEDFVHSVVNAVGRNRSKVWSDARAHSRDIGVLKGGMRMVFVGLRLWTGDVKRWWKGHRFSVGAGGKYMSHRLFSRKVLIRTCYSLNVRTGFISPNVDPGPASQPSGIPHLRT